MSRHKPSPSTAVGSVACKQSVELHQSSAGHSSTTAFSSVRLRTGIKVIFAGLFVLVCSLVFYKHIVPTRQQTTNRLSPQPVTTTRRPAILQTLHTLGLSTEEPETVTQAKSKRSADLPEQLEFGPFDEPNRAEYTNVLTALRLHLGQLYAVDGSGPKTNQSYYDLSLRPWTEQLKANFLWAVNLHIPNKAQRTAYFEKLQQDSGPVEPPPRYAHAVVFHPPEVREYLVGPMNEPKEIRLLRTVPYYKRPLGTIEYEALIDFLTIHCARLDPLLQEAYGASFLRDEPSGSAPTVHSSGNSLCQAKYDRPNARGRPHCLMPTFTSPMITHAAPGRRRTWLRLMHQVIAFIQQPVDIQFDLVLSGDIGPVEIKQGVCLFESTIDPPGSPVRRHFEFVMTPPTEQDIPTSQGNDFTNFGFAAPGRALTLRFITSLFNYDYLFDVVFHTTGVLEFAVTPSGHVHIDAVYPWPITDRSASRQPENTPHAFGFLSNTDLLSFVIHHHLFHFKLDVDVVDQMNTFDAVHVYGPLSLNDSRANLQCPGQTEPGLPPGLWMTKTRIRTELEARFHTKFELPVQYLTCAKPVQDSPVDRPNHRCINLVNKGAIKTLLSDTHTQAFAWTRHQLSVTRQHDSEPHASSIYNGVDLFDPYVNFTKFSENNESIENEVNGIPYYLVRGAWQFDGKRFITSQGGTVTSTDDVNAVGDETFAIYLYKSDYRE
ncbi:unnamed protein product [Echinostoma caproni]|uniref:Amine oxidase n=1 Tax=Echinostoma caproni TaxID=27848 RepID=A0A183AIS7_9TREM|nr:unnamed protein product [Echinostoma caproni]